MAGGTGGCKKRGLESWGWRATWPWCRHGAGPAPSAQVGAHVHRQIGDRCYGPQWWLQSCKTSIRSSDRTFRKCSGTSSQAVDAWPLPDPSRASRFPLTRPNRRDSIPGTGRYWPDKQPAQVLVTPARA